MKGKKLLGIIVTISMTLTLIAPTVSAKNLGPTVDEKAMVGQAAPPCKSAIIQSLMESGEISKEATAEEVEQIYKKYIKQNMTVEIQKPVENSSSTRMRRSFLKADGADQWDGKSFEIKPVVILMDFTDYSYKDFLTKDPTAIMKYDNYEKETYENTLFGEDTYKLPTGQEFITMNKFYKEMSGGSYSVKGKVFGWYHAKHEAAYYGGNGPDANNSEDQKRSKFLIEEAIEQVKADPNFHAEEYDRINNKNGKDHTPDGIIDKVIVVHAGRGEEMGGGSLKTDAMWPFRMGFTWYSGGAAKEITDTYGKTILVDDFVSVEQDVTPGLLGHEFGHTMGAPDEYGNDEPIQNWSLMSAGSYNGALPGTVPVQMGPFSRRMMQDLNGGNWINEKVIDLGEIGEKGLDFNLNQSFNRGDQFDVLRINLPDRETRITTPSSLKQMYFSGAGNNLKNSMSTTIDLRGKQTAELKFKTFYQIDPEYDYGSIEVREVGTEKWTSIAGNITTTANPQKDESAAQNPPGRNPGNGITNDSGQKWVDAKFDLSAYKGKQIEMMFYFWTDTNTPELGMYIDDIKINADGQEILSDDAEGQPKFTLNGFTVDDGIKRGKNYYLVEWRNGQGQDEGLNHMPWVNGATVANDPGLLVWYVDLKYFSDGRLNQNTGINGDNCLGVVDADQNAVYWKQGTQTDVDDGKYQLRDAAFSLRKNSPLKITWNNGTVTEDTHTFMNPYFDDRADYSNAKTPKYGVNVPKLGLKIYVTGQSQDNTSGTIHISK